MLQTKEARHAHCDRNEVLAASDLGSPHSAETMALKKEIAVLARMKSVSHHMGVQTVIEHLRIQHGQVRAHKLVLLEQQKARRARCRKRFHFSGAVASEIGIERQAGASPPCSR